jgi:hypothetical protein
MLDTPLQFNARSSRDAIAAFLHHLRQAAAPASAGNAIYVNCSTAFSMLLRAARESQSFEFTVVCLRCFKKSLINKLSLTQALSFSRQ